MIAVCDNPRSPMVCLFKTLRGYVGGNAEPFAFESRAATTDANLLMLGVRRVTEWEAVPNQPRTVWAKVVENP